MVQLKILSGERAGTSWGARRFPVRIGRSATADLTLEDNGVWDEHAQLEFRPTEGFRLQVHPDALACVNGQPVQETILRNGDRIELGAATLQFWLAESRQAGFRASEWLIWASILLISLGQVFLVYWLLP